MAGTALREKTGVAPTSYAPIVFDVDGAVVEQHGFMARYRPHVVALQDRHAELRHWCRWNTMEELAGIVAAAIDQAGGPTVSFYGNSDNHHFVWAFVKAYREPLTTVGIDGHSDLFRATGKYCWAGNWMAEILKFPNVGRHIQIGVDRDLNLMREFPIPMGALIHRIDLLRTGRVEVYPTSLRESRLVGRERFITPCVEMRPSWLLTHCRWRNIRDHGGMEAMADYMIDRMETDAVYLTIDKDGLCDEDQFSNQFGGRQGTMTRDELVIFIKALKRRKTLVGVDVCGDFSVPVSPRKSFKERWSDYEMKSMPADAREHPERYTPRNEVTNIAIMEALNGD